MRWGTCRALAILLSVVISMPSVAVSTVCASPAQTSAGSTLTAAEQAAVMRKFVSGLQVGSTIKIRVRNRGTLKAILMAVEEHAIIVQPKTRIPEPVRMIPLESIERLELDRGGGVGKAIAIGAAAGAGAALGVLMILAAIFAD